MFLKEIYERPINRTLNPAVSAGSLDAETVKTEIDEYVFTEEIIDGLYNVMNAIHRRSKSHAGIWINGYFGSGKSHFLKYLNYCFDAAHRDHALERLEKEVAEKFDPIVNTRSKLNETISDIRDLIAWLKKAEVERVLFNIAQVHDYHGQANRTFLDVFWNEFNRHRGYNPQNLALAQYFEKALDRHGKLAEFKQLMEEDGYDWATQADELAIGELDMVLEKGKSVCPELSIESIKKNIEAGTVVLSVERFATELADFLKDKGEDYRMVFLVDEVSQFINSRRNLLLQLQSIVELLPVACQKKVWVACTAQQDLSEIVESCEISETSDDYGKIMGRFEVKVSLKGMNPEYITRCRILEKNGVAIGELGKLYNQEKSNLELQYKMPSPNYKAYETRDDFINYYPFVPFQLTLIQQVFNAFESLGYVVSEVKGNERSVLKVTYSTAQQTADNQLGYVVPFDCFFSTMFQTSLMAKGQKALNNAAKIAREYTDPDFASRVVNTLFMVSNLNPADRQLFKATTDNLVMLLADNCNANILVLKNDIQAVLDYLCKNSAIRKETDNMKEDIYLFYNEEEMNLATQIRSSKLDPAKRADVMWDLIYRYFDIQQKKSFHSRSFTLGVELWNRSIYNPNTSDMVVDIVMDSTQPNAESHVYGRDKKYLTIFLAQFYSENATFRENFFNYCQTQSYIEHNPAPSASLQKIYQGFQERAEILLETKILPELHRFLDGCPILSGTVLIPASQLTKKGKERFSLALAYHMNTLYSEAGLVDGFPTDATELAKYVSRPLPGIGEIEEQLPMASQRVKQMLVNKTGETCLVTELIKDFTKAPYGWNDICTLTAINFLVRSRQFRFVYGNDSHVDQKTVAAKLYKEREKFEIAAAEMIPQEIVNNFIAAWKKSFAVVSVCPSNDTTAIFEYCKNDEVGGIVCYKKNCNNLLTEFAKYPFVNVVREAIDLLDTWYNIRDTRKFFQKVTEDVEVAFKLFNKVRDLEGFKKERFDTYKAIIEFVSSNAENIGQLEGADSTVEALRKIVDDEWPLDSIRAYNKQKDELSKAISEKMQEKVQAINMAYERAYSSLVEFGTTLGLKEPAITYLPNIQTVVGKNTASKSLVSLDLALKNVDDFESNYKQILVVEKSKQDAADAASMVPPVPPEPIGGDPIPVPEPVTPPVAPAPQPKVFDPKKSLKFRSGKRLKNEQDVDELLADLKKQLMEQVNNSEIIIM